MVFATGPEVQLSLKEHIEKNSPVLGRNAQYDAGHNGTGWHRGAPGGRLASVVKRCVVIHDATC